MSSTQAPLLNMRSIQGAENNFSSRKNLFFWRSWCPRIEAGKDSRLEVLFYFILILLGLFPAGVMSVIGLGFHNYIIAMFFMHWVGMTTLPFLFILIKKNVFPSTPPFQFYYDFFKKQLRGETRVENYTNGGFLLFFSALSGSLLFMTLKCPPPSAIGSSSGKCIASVIDRLELFGIINYPLWVLLVLSAYFTLVNPVVEEFFWRVFLHNEIGLKYYPLCSQGPEGGEAGWRMEEGRGVYGAVETVREGEREAEGGREPESAACSEEGVTEQGKILISLLYASYHFVVISSLLNSLLLGASAFFGLIVLGRFFEFFRDSESFGIRSSVLCHVGVDFVVIFAFGVQYLEHNSIFQGRVGTA